MIREDCRHTVGRRSRLAESPWLEVGVMIGMTRAMSSSDAGKWTPTPTAGMGPGRAARIFARHGHRDRRAHREPSHTNRCGAGTVNAGGTIAIRATASTGESTYVVIMSAVVNGHVDP